MSQSNGAMPAPQPIAAAPHERHRTTTEQRHERHLRRTRVVQWVRKMHGWFGLWGALLGLLFGSSGIWLNHRAQLKLPPMAQQRVNAQIALPDPPPATAQAMGAWLQQALGAASPASSLRVESSRPVAWTERNERATGLPGSPALLQPERWSYTFGGPRELIQADYWRGNRSVSVLTTSNGLLATLTNLHKGVAMPLAWILLVDTLAGSLILLCLSGLFLWLQTSRKRLLGGLIFLLSASLTLGLALAGL